MDILSYVLGYNKGKAQGGGSGGGSGGSADDRVKYVTYMDRGAELIKYPVIEGDTARDPVAKGYIEKPTKEPTASTVYTQSGWSKTDGGAPDSTALQNVTEDRTVYAAYTESVRKYTIRFFDDDGSILETQQLNYGAMPAYAPTKDGYLLVGWTPAISAVTADIDYTAVWEESVAFAAAGWDKIIERANDGTAAKAWAVGDSKDLTLNYANGTSETVTVTIGAFNAGKMADGNACKIAFVLTQPLKTLQKWDTVGSKNTSSFSAEYYNGMTLNKYLDDTVFPALPTELKENIIARSFCISFSMYTAAVVERKLWGVHEADLMSSFGDRTYPMPFAKNSVLSTADSRIMIPRGATEAVEWYLGSVTPSSSSSRYLYPQAYDTSGNIKENSGGYDVVTDGHTTARGVVFGFCI